MNRSLRNSAAILVVAAMPAIALGGCESVERETGISKRTQMGAGGGAAVGGVIAAIAGANPAWIAASTILGGVAGGAITEYLGRDDAKKHASNQYSALDTLKKGETSSWRNADTGHYGSTSVNEVFAMADGTQCKNFTETVHAGGKTVTQSATACKKPGGDWEVRTA